MTYGTEKMGNSKARYNVYHHVTGGGEGVGVAGEDDGRSRASTRTKKTSVNI